jgi:MarR family transcriptional regulator, organic hydroperoxide resistance regulator
VKSYSILLELQRATHASLGRLSAELADLDLSASEINALGNLADGPVTPTQLGTAIGIRPTTLTSVLDRLERRGLLTRGVRAGDRRSVLLTLTPDGEAGATAVRAAMAAVEKACLAGLNATQLAGLRAGLAALAGEAS